MRTQEIARQAAHQGEGAMAETGGGCANEAASIDVSAQSGLLPSWPGDHSTRYAGPAKPVPLFIEA